MDDEVLNKRLEKEAFLVQSESALETYRSIRNLCSEKCILTLKEPALNDADQTCLKRCAYKYYEVQVSAVRRFTARAQQTAAGNPGSPASSP